MPLFPVATLPLCGYPHPHVFAWKLVSHTLPHPVRALTLPPACRCTCARATSLTSRPGCRTGGRRGWMYGWVYCCTAVRASVCSRALAGGGVVSLHTQAYAGTGQHVRWVSCCLAVCCRAPPFHHTQGQHGYQGCREGITGCSAVHHRLAFSCKPPGLLYGISVCCHLFGSPSCLLASVPHPRQPPQGSVSDVSDRQQRSQLVERVSEEFGGKLNILSE